MIVKVPKSDAFRLAQMFWIHFRRKSPGSALPPWESYSREEKEGIRDSLIEAIADFSGESEKAYETFSTNCTKAKHAIVEHSVSIGFIKNDGGRKGRPVAGKFPCPICGCGDLSYSRSSYNGHVNAKCSTPNCVSFIE